MPTQRQSVEPDAPLPARDNEMAERWTAALGCQPLTFKQIDIILGPNRVQLAIGGNCYPTVRQAYFLVAQ